MKPLNDNNTPVVGITVGDPAGIGPEVVMKSLAGLVGSDVVIIAGARELKRQAAVLGIPCPYPVASSKDDLHLLPRPVVFDTGQPHCAQVMGIASAESGKAAIASVESAVDLWRSGLIDAVATAPLNKSAIKLAGSPFPGHTEMLASLTGTPGYLMAFFAGRLRVVLLTIHVSLKEAIRAITKDLALQAIVLTDRELRRFGIENPRIAMAGLNPHAGENGLFGDEETLHLRPAAVDARSRGIRVSDPLPSDTLFIRTSKGEFDAVIACYHDQGLIPIKSMAFGSSAGVTLGLPLIRTSVDHGTAFDIAGRNLADPRSMAVAIALAQQLAGAERAARSN